MPAPSKIPSSRRFVLAARVGLVLSLVSLPLAVAVPLAYLFPRPLSPAPLAHFALYSVFVLAACAGILARAAHRHPAARRTARRAFTLAGIDFAVVAASWAWLLFSVLRDR